MSKTQQHKPIQPNLQSNLFETHCDNSPFKKKIHAFQTGSIYIPTVTGNDIMNLRSELGLRQKEVAKLIGTSASSISRWEKQNAALPIPYALLLLTLGERGASYFNAMREVRATPPNLPESNHVSEYTAGAIRRIREQNGMTRKAFARLVCVTRNAVDKWETGASRPSGTARQILALIERFGACGYLALFQHDTPKSAKSIDSKEKHPLMRDIPEI